LDKNGYSNKEGCIRNYDGNIAQAYHRFRSTVKLKTVISKCGYPLEIKQAAKVHA